MSLKASTEAEGDVLQMIHLLCDALKEFDFTSTVHYEAGYARRLFPIGRPNLLLTIDLESRGCRFNHFSVLAQLCQENALAMPAYQNAIVNALHLGRQKNNFSSMFLPSKVALCPSHLMINLLLLPVDAFDLTVRCLRFTVIGRQ
jgi:hypothetical protein